MHPRAFKAKFPEGSKASASRYEPSHFFSGPVDSYSQSGSVPSYMPASLESKPSQAQQPSLGIHRSQPRMWDTFPQSERKGSKNIVSSGAIVMQAEKTPEQQSGLTSDAHQAGSSYTNLPPNHPAVLQSRPGIWDRLFAQSPVKQPEMLPVPKTRVGAWDKVFTPSAQSLGPSYPGRLPPNHPAFSAPAVVQSKAGMWDSLFASSAQSPGSYPQANFPQILEPSVKESKSNPWKTVPASKPQTAGSTHPGRLPPNHPAFSNPAVPQTKVNVWDMFGSSAESPAEMLQRSALPQNKPVWYGSSGSSAHGSTHPGRLPLNHPVFSNPAVLQSKEGMWDSLFASGPRGSRPEASGSYPLSQQQPKPASSTSQHYGGVVDKMALKPSPRSSKTAPVPTFFESGHQRQLASTHGKHSVVS